MPLTKYIIDSRAQRKVEDGFDLVTVISNAAAAADGINFFLHLRTLVKLH